MTRMMRGGLVVSLVCLLAACGAEDASVSQSSSGYGASGAAGGAGGVGGSSSSGLGGTAGSGGSGTAGGGPCASGDTQPCYTGDPATEGLGSCHAGTRTCVAGNWLACEGEVTPVDEICDGADENCNALVDDATELTCGVGSCQVTVPGCDGGQPNDCVPLDPAPIEACDGLDDDCDGVIDNGCACTNGQTQSCYNGPPSTAGVGLCVVGSQTCVAGSWAACGGQILPATEECNGLDDDCDGAIDEGCPCIGGDTQLCYGGPADTSGVGACQEGTQTCAAGVWGDCAGDVTPTPEICDSADNDCDGDSDEGDPGGGESCSTGLSGVCAAGTTACNGGVVDCEQNQQSSAEACDGLDNDCDGTADDGNPGGGQSCSTGQPGVCAAGTSACTGGSLVCSPNQAPSPEVCDTLDNDCNGVADDGNPGGGQVCNTGQPGVCAAGTTTCVNGGVFCVQNNQPSAEVCDGLDNNCDGVPDDGDPGGGQDCSTGLPGVCAPGTITCTGGSLLCTQDVPASSEACDGFDNDCDGGVDENDPGICGTLPNATPACVNTSCVIGDCATGYCDANSTLGDGCEHDLDLNPTCSSYIDLGAVSGDTSSTSGGCAGNTCLWTGNGERWFRVRVDENASGICAENLCARITLNPMGAAMDYDLYGYCDNCSGSDASSVLGSGSTDTIYMMWDENTIWDPFCSGSNGASGSDSGRYLYINVTMFSVDECDNYTLTVTGDVCGSSNTCGSK